MCDIMRLKNHELAEDIYIQKWCTEDWQFELTAIEGKAGHCRLGLEKGDKFANKYPPA